MFEDSNCMEEEGWDQPSHSGYPLGWRENEAEREQEEEKEVSSPASLISTSSKDTDWNGT